MEIKTSASTTTPGLDRWENAMERKAYLRPIGNAGSADIKRNVGTRGANIGRTWPPLAWREGGQRLRDNGTLMQSIHPEVSGDTALVVATKQSKGVNIAAVQHFGARIKITPRMRAYLHHIGKHLKRSKTHIVIPPTEFMTFSDRFTNHELPMILAQGFKK